MPLAVVVDLHDDIVVRTSDGIGRANVRLSEGADLVSRQNTDLWLAEATAFNGLGSSYKRGDGNLNGIVDGADFIIWNANKFTLSVGRWSRPDFNCDGQTDGQDFSFWNANKSSSSDLAGGSNFADGTPIGLAARQDLSPNSPAAGSSTNARQVVEDRRFSGASQTRVSWERLTEPQAAISSARDSVAEIVFKRPSGPLPPSGFALQQSSGSGVSPVGSPSVSHQLASRTSANVGNRPYSVFLTDLRREGWPAPQNSERAPQPSATYCLTIPKCHEP